MIHYNHHRYNMKKRSISDQCLVSETLQKLRLREQNATDDWMSRTKSMDKLGDGESSHQRLSGRIKESSRGISRIFRLKPKSANQLSSSSMSSNAAKNNDVTRGSPFFHATSLMDYQNCDDLNAKIDMIKQSMIENINKLKDRDISIQDLEQKADYLNQHALSLNMVSTNIKKQQKSLLRSDVRSRLVGLLIVFFGLSTVYSYFIYFKISDFN